MKNKQAFINGVRDGFPIATGYFAVAFTLGIAARKAGVTPLQSMIISATNVSSTGEYIGFTNIAANVTYLEMAIMIIIANARYILLSAALSQKFDATMKAIHRFVFGFLVTDEIFGISIAVKDKLNPWYTYGAGAIAIPGWSIGTYIGVAVGNILPSNIVSALGVGLYGMFIAIIIPPSKKDKIIAILVVISMICSYIASRVPVIVNNLSSGTRVIILTIAISTIAALAFPVKEARNDA